MSSKNGQFYLFANWKMYLDFDESNILANALAQNTKKFSKNIKMAVFPSALSLYSVGQVLNDIGVAVGAQNLYWVEKGGYTGEISAQMYKAAGCQYALVGHSERRHLFKETNDEVRKKLESALSCGLTPVLCVGETDKQRADNRAQEVVTEQLQTALSGLAWPEGRELIVAYEPVWAIGTGNNCIASDAQTMHQFIKKELEKILFKSSPVLLYGGSVRGNNVAEYLSQTDIHGVLVGGASAKLDSWLEIVERAVF